MAKSKITPVRLNPSEQEMLATLLARENAVASNASELFRLLLLREFKRTTTGKSQVAQHEIASDFRTGRPLSQLTELSVVYTPPGE